ncbi:MAG: HTH domain-containing protein [Nanoarchaeota archaeon]
MDENSNLVERLPWIITGLSTEMKILPLFGLDKSPRNRCEVRDGLLERLGHDAGELEIPALASIGHACKRPLFKAGAVEITPGGYRLTSLGKDVILPIAALMINYSATSGLSLYNLFGEDSTKASPSAPFGRFKTLLSIAEKGTTSKKKLAQDTGLSEDAINRYSNILRINGLIGVESIGDNEERAEAKKYKIKSDSDKIPVPRRAKIVFNALAEVGEASATSVANRLNERKVKLTPRKVRDILNELIMTSHLEYASNSWSEAQVCSRVTAYNGVYDFADKLARPLMRALSEPAYLAEVRDTYLVPFESPDYLRTQLNLALSNYRNSTNRLGPRLDNARQNQRAKQLLDVLPRDGEITSSKHLAEELGVSRTTLKLTVRDLKDSGVITIIPNSITGKRFVALRP